MKFISCVAALFFCVGRIVAAENDESSSRELQAITCGAKGPFTIAGSSGQTGQSSAWATPYRAACTNVITVVPDGTSTDGANRVCAVPGKGTPVEVGATSRQLKSTEATKLANGYDYRCVAPGATTRVVREFPVGVDGVVVVYKRTGIAASCIASLKGLSTNQLRWAYSNYTRARLVSAGWPIATLPRNDNRDTTHLWSELGGGAACPATEIGIGGSPSTGGTYGFVSGIWFTGTGEGFRTGYFSDPNNNDQNLVNWVNANSARIAYLSYDLYRRNAASLGVASIRNAAGAFIAPTVTTIGAGTYPYNRLLYLYLLTASASFGKTAPFVRFGVTTTRGDQLSIGANVPPISKALETSILPRFTLRRGVRGM